MALKSNKKNLYIPPGYTNNPVFGAVTYAYSKIASKYKLNNYFDVRQSRHISYLPNILQRARTASHVWPDKQPKVGSGTVATQAPIK